MNKRNSETFKETIIEDIKMINEVFKIINAKLKEAQKENSRSVDYYTRYMNWLEALKGNLLEILEIQDENKIKEQIMNKELLPAQKESIVLMRTNNAFYKKVSADYAREIIDDILNLLEDESEDEDIELDFDVSSQIISNEKIKEKEERIKRITKEKAKVRDLNIPISERSHYKNIDSYLDDYIRILTISKNKFKVKRTPSEIFDNTKDLAEKVQVLKNEGIITSEQNRYYHGILFHLAEYYTGVSEGEQLPIEEGLRGIKIDRDLFKINQCIAEAVYEAYKYPEEKSTKSKPKTYRR